MYSQQFFHVENIKLNTTNAHAHIFYQVISMYMYTICVCIYNNNFCHLVLVYCLQISGLRATSNIINTVRKHTWDLFHQNNRRIFFLNTHTHTHRDWWKIYESYAKRRITFYFSNSQTKIRTSSFPKSSLFFARPRPNILYEMIELENIHKLIQKTMLQFARVIYRRKSNDCCS